MRCLAVFFLTYTVFASFHEEELYGPIGPPTTARPNRPQQTRSLSGTIATDGNYAFNDELFEIMTLWLLKGFAIFKVKQYNDRVYLDRTRRSYWFGDRYYQLDNLYYLSTRDTCAYRMNETQRKNIYYEDDTPIYDIYYQCQRYVEYCCGLDCCKYTDMGRTRGERQPPKTPWDISPNQNVLFPLIFMPILYVQINAMADCRFADHLGNLHKFRVHTGNINTYVELKLKRYKDSAEELSACLDIQMQADPLGNQVNMREDGTFLLCDNAHIDHYDRGDLKITLKVFLSSWNPEELRESVDCLMSELNTKNIELLIIATPEVEYIDGETDEEEFNRWKKLIKPLWEFLSSLVDNGKVASLGIAEGTVQQLQSLIADYDVRPTVDHLRHDGCCAVPAELKDFANDHSISLLTHNDPHPFPTTNVFHDFCNMGDNNIEAPSCDPRFKATWAARYTVWVRCRSIMASKGYLVQFERTE